MTLRTFFPVVLILAACAFAQTEPSVPCEYDKEILRNRHGRIALFTSDEMKARATYKRDITGAAKQWDIKGTAIFEVLVAPDGHVLCMKSLAADPMVRKYVEDALRQRWFSPFKVHGKNVAYVGQLEFTLCNMSCGDAGPHMTIIK
jgi:hypothetical protein